MPVPRRTRSKLYAGMKENMGPPSNRVRIKTKSDAKKLSPTRKDMEITGLVKSKTPLGEKNVAQIVSNERRLSVREGAKRSAVKITELCKKIKNVKNKSSLDKENAHPLIMNHKKKIGSPSPNYQDCEILNITNTILEENTGKKPTDSANILDVHVFASPNKIPCLKSITKTSNTDVQAPVRRLSIREGARKSKDKIAEICRNIKNLKKNKEKEADSPQETLKENNAKLLNVVSDTAEDKIEENANQQRASKRKCVKTVLSENNNNKLMVTTKSLANPEIIEEKDNTSPHKKLKRKCKNNKKIVVTTKSVEKPEIIEAKENTSPHKTLKRKCNNNKKLVVTTKSIEEPAIKEKDNVSPEKTLKRKYNNNKKIIGTEKSTERPANIEEKENTSPEKILKQKFITSPLGKNKAKRIINNDFPFRLLDKKSVDDTKNREAVYEFTFDPSEEPPVQKKKRKQGPRKKPQPKPKQVLVNKNYDANISKTLQSLKESVSKKVANTEQNKCVTTKNTNSQANQAQITKEISKPVPHIEQVTSMDNGSELSALPPTPVQIAKESDQFIESPAQQLEITSPAMPFNEPVPLISEPVKNVLPETTTPSKGPSNKSSENNVEEIEAQWGLTDENDDLNYSPAHVSFNNILSSTLNTSVRIPQGSPWRPDFENLPFKWQSNSYVKPNMTPAIETSFVVSDKKHVYTNMLQEDDTPPETIETLETDKETPKLKQLSIMSFVGEPTEKTTRRTRSQKKVDGPSRANLPRTALNFAPSADVVNKLYNEMKAASDAPEVPERNEDGTNVEPAMDEMDEASVHLFEDIDVVHHLKPTRKSYGKAKKLTFCKTVVDNTAQGDAESDGDSDAERQALDDLTFELPNIKTKKPAKKKKKAIKLTKKEEEEVEAWAAAFNSMCEDVEEFPLVTE